MGRRGAGEGGQGCPGGPPPPHFNFRTKHGPKVSVSNIRDIAFYGCSEIIRTRNFTVFTVYLWTIYGLFMDNFWTVHIF